MNHNQKQEIKVGTYVRFTANRLFGDRTFKVIEVISPGESLGNGTRNASKENLYRCIQAGYPEGKKYIFLESQLKVL